MRQKTEDRGRRADCCGQGREREKSWLMKNASSYKPHKILCDKDLHGFALVWGFYPFGPCSPREIRAGDISPGESVESVVSDLFDNCRESSTNRPCVFKTKPISAKAKICAIAVLIKDYENKGVFAGRRSKAKQTQLQAPAKMDANLFAERGL